MNKEAKLKMDELKELGEKELWLVESHITSEKAKASTWLWFVYRNEEDALRWISLCSILRTGEDFSDEVKKLAVGESDAVAWNYIQDGYNMINKFVVTHYCGES